MGEVYYIWGDTESGRMQVAFSSIVKAMLQEDLYAIIRMVTGNNFAPKLGVAVPRTLEKVDCLLWTQVWIISMLFCVYVLTLFQMPFAEDNRNYTFQSLDQLYNKKGVKIEKHPNIPTNDMLDAMENFVDSMDLMEVEKDDEG